MSLHSLFLSPKDTRATPSMSAIQSVLSNLEIIGPPLEGDVFRAGPGFAKHIVFAGCSPYLPMEPPDDGSLRFCHIALQGPFSTPRLVTGTHTVSPRCPSCRHRFSDWRGLLQTHTVDPGSIDCPGCGTRHEICALDWRQRAACGRVLIELRNVFPGEAMPSDTLIASLQRATRLPWAYAWSDYLLNADA